MPKEVERLNEAESSLALAGDIFELKFNDEKLAHQLYLSRWKAHYDAKDGIDASQILNDAHRCETLVKVVGKLLKEEHVTTQPILARQKRFITARYGIKDGTPKSFEALGGGEHVKHQWVWDIVKSGILNLRHPLRSGDLRTFLEECSILSPVYRPAEDAEIETDQNS